MIARPRARRNARSCSPRNKVCRAFTGPPTSGKTEALVRRFAALVAADPELAGAAIVSAARDAGARARRAHGGVKKEALVRRFAALVAGDPALAEAAIITAARDDGARALAARIARATGIAVRGATLDALAFELLRAHPLETGLALDLELVDPLDAEEIFERAAAPLFSAEWSDWLGADVDPEIAGLRTPARFADAALHLIRKLRDSGIDDAAFLVVAQRGATTFYANPPNLASPVLLSATKDEHRASLAVGASELERQRKRELDLAKILARLYRAYVDELVRRGCLTASDALDRGDAAAGEPPRDRPRAAAPAARRVRRRRARPLRGCIALLARAVRRRARRRRRRRRSRRGDADVRRRAPRAHLRPRRDDRRARAAHAAPADRRGDARRDRRRPRAPRAARRRRSRAARRRPRGGSERRRRPRRAARARGNAARAHRGRAPHAAHARRLRGRADRARRAGRARRRSGAVRARRTCATRSRCCGRRSTRSTTSGRCARCRRRCCGCPTRRSRCLCGEPASPQPALFAMPEAEADGDRRWDRKRDLRLGTNVLHGERDARPVRRRARTAGRVSRAAHALVRMAACERRRDRRARDRRGRRLAAAARRRDEARARGCARR